ncbi:maltodextrin glucosidase [Vibrio mediterranei]|uniref:maltodextrin glucosidase n=1 Tax=Vibrio mediterranei TaxID=689 RepID=UPI00148BF87D|nr:maltodextrin glucosidase [Vibrio mediterranei]NOI22213.1 maltodextrin glucosidase [Vibrio mediterranei]
MTQPFLFHPQTHDGVVRVEDKLTITLFAEAKDYESVSLRHEPDNEEYIVPMSKVGTKGRLDIWQATLPLSEDKDVTYYVFKALTQTEQYWLDARGVQKRMPGREYHFKYNRCHQPPSWVAEQVFYQIFPERFCNGDPELAVETGEYQYPARNRQSVKKQWGESVGTHGDTGAVEFFGGDLAGIESKLDYLQDLGITTLYLNPIFTSYSNHKYDTVDYYSIDPKFGTNEQFAQLTDKLHQRGLKVVLDAVLNHTSISHSWFDILSQGNGAYTSQDSPYRDYYFFEADSDRYVGWKGIDTLPVLNFHNQEVCNQIYLDESSVIKYWLKPPYNIDGWRFDVIHMLGEGEGATNNAHYVKAFRDSMKSVNPDSYMLGEHFFEATQWLQGDQEDGAMNYYGFAHPVRALLASKDIQFDPINIDCHDFLEWLQEASAKVPWNNQLSQLNQLDSHDTERFITTLSGDKAKFAIANQLLMSYVGTPCLYYGAEIALEGSHDPDNRRCFPWEQVEHSEWLPYFKKIIAIRRSSKALQKGSFMPLYVDEDCLVFARQLDSDVVLSGFNLGKQSNQVELPVWKLGIEQGAFRCPITEKMISANKGMLTVSIEGEHSLLLTH